MSYDQLLYLSAVILFAASSICGSIHNEKDARIEDIGLTISSLVLVIVAIILQSGGN